MHPIFIVLIVLLALVLVALLLMLYMIYPGKKRPEMEKFKSYRYAHRGLHDDTKAENSMSAFAAAKEKGYGIELDVRLSKDGELVVFHDDNLTRVVGIDGKVIDYTAEELSKMSLSGTADGVPTFRRVLDLIDGAVPLIIEVKMHGEEKGISEKLVEVLEGYKGDYVVESFNPIALKIIRKLRPDILRGILAAEYLKEEKHKGKILYTLLQHLMLNFMVRPDFIAYEKNGYKVKGLRFVRRSFGTALVAWTIKSQDEEKAAISHGFDAVIFEGYIPEE
ncbi:MAG: glycerophosphodiester phosphodiesterase [Clostridia bacterium]|nr:glycerophosphodiester phosphodiesterase [Clostridia bacterium]MBQ7390986.1 glycerophosphodiester phosphodiesterase [Clostridia bacterium]